MQDKQNELRNRLYTFLKTRGIKQKFVAEQCNINVSILCRYLSGQRDLWDDSLEQLEVFLQKNDK